MAAYRNQHPPQPTPPVLAPKRIPVIARLVLDDYSEECYPAIALRWTATHVMVSIQADPGNPDSTFYVWLLAEDIARVLRTPHHHRRQMWPARLPSPARPPGPDGQPDSLGGVHLAVAT